MTKHYRKPYIVLKAKIKEEWDDFNEQFDEVLHWNPGDLVGVFRSVVAANKAFTKAASKKLKKDEGIFIFAVVPLDWNGEDYYPMLHQYSDPDDFENLTGDGAGLYSWNSRTGFEDYYVRDGEKDWQNHGQSFFIVRSSTKIFTPQPGNSSDWKKNSWDKNKDKKQNKDRKCRSMSISASNVA